MKYRKVLDKIGLDKTVAYSSGARVIQAFTGFTTLLFVAHFLTGEEQGYYYTFLSIQALQIFFELGLTGSLIQFVAHEASYLSLEGTDFVGPNEYRSRLASLLRFSVRWYAVISVLFFVFVLAAGCLFFYKISGQSTYVSWELPFLLLTFGTSTALFISPIRSYLTGIGKIQEMNKIGFWQQIIYPFFVWGSFLLGAKLYTLGIGSVINTAIWLIYVYRTKLLLILKSNYKEHVTSKVKYMTEIFPFQWRIAISWISLYFTSYFFNPVLFAAEGPVVAGQMGMTITVLAGIQTLSFSWLNAKIPYYCQLIALHKYNELDSQFNTTLRQMLGVCLALLSSTCAGIVGLQGLNSIGIGGDIGGRFLYGIPLLLMCMSYFCTSIINAWESYCRCHKQEPYFIYSIVNGILCCVSSIVFGRIYGVYGITVSYSLICVLGIPWTYYIYRESRRKWHSM